MTDVTGVGISGVSKRGDMYYVYMMSNLHDTVLYVGITNDLIRRVYEHKHHLEPKSFTARYNITKLVYYESVENSESAINREKQLRTDSCTC